MAGLILGTHHVCLKMWDLESYAKAVAFYRDILEMDVVRTWGSDERPAIMLDTGDSVMEITLGGKELPLGNIHHFALATNQVDEAIEKVRAAGYAITMEPRDVQLGTLSARVAFCDGPAGESIEFFMEK